MGHLAPDTAKQGEDRKLAGMADRGNLMTLEGINRKAVVFYALGGVLFSLAGLLFRPLTGVLGPLEIAGWRSVTLFFSLLLIRGFLGRSPLSLPLSFSKWQFFAAVAMAVQATCFSIAILITSTADTFLITNATPVYMVVWQLLIDKRRPTKTEIIIVMIAALGLLIFFADAMGKASVLGIAAGLTGGMAFAGHIYGQGKVGREGTKNGEPFTIGSVILGSVIMALVILPLTAVTTGIHIFEAPYWAVLCVLGLGTFQFAVPLMLWAKALPFIPPLLAAFMPTLIAIWAPCLTFFILSEPFPGALSIFGAVIVHAAVIYAASRNLRAAKKQIAV